MLHNYILNEKEKAFIKEVLSALMDLVEGLDAETYSGSDKIYLGDKAYKLLDGEITEEERKELDLL